MPGSGIVISQLNPDYLDSSGRCATITPNKPKRRLRPLAHVITWLQQHSHSSSWARPGLTAAQAAVTTAAGSLRSGAHVFLAALRQLPTTATHDIAYGTAQDMAGPAVLHFDQSARGPSAAGGDVGAPCLFSLKGKWYLLAAHSSDW